jgi:hypothetical protein
MKKFVAIGVFALALSNSSTTARAQVEQSWTAPNDAFSLTIPEMWNPVRRSEPEVLLFLRSLGHGPSGPSAIACTIEHHSTPVHDDSLTRERLDDLNQAMLTLDVRQELHPLSSSEMVNGVRVAAYEAAQTLHHGLTDHHFARTFILQEGQEIVRYVLLCNVTTVTPGVEADFAITREFLSSLHINPEPRP